MADKKGSINLETLKKYRPKINTELGNFQSFNNKYKTDVEGMNKDGIYGGTKADSLYDNLKTRYDRNKKTYTEISQLQNILKKYEKKLIEQTGSSN